MVAARIFFPALALVATTLAGQEARTIASAGPLVTGTVRDAAGAPVSDVEVGVLSGQKLQQFVITTDDGKFLLTGVAAGIVPLRIRRLGYGMQYFEVDTRNPTTQALDIVLTQNVSDLEDVMIAANDQMRLREYYQRKEQRASFGLFLEAPEIRQRGATNPSDLFRNVPGIDIRTASGGNTIRIRGCQPMVWLDGQRVPGAELDEVIHPSQIAAIEFYPSSAGIPAQYLERGNRLCGSVLVWTRAQ